MGLFNKSKNASGSACTAVQTSSVSAHPFGRLNNSVSLNHGSYIYSMLRQSVPIIDVAISKIVRLCSGFKFETGNEKIDSDMNEFFENISVGGNQQGINMFVSAYLEQLLTYGYAVGEMTVAFMRFTTANSARLMQSVRRIILTLSFTAEIKN